MRRRHLTLQPVPALTQDGWRANIQASLEYQVRSLHGVVQLGDPLKALNEAAVSAITSVIKATPHNLLIGTSDHSDESHEAIAADVQKRLQAALRGSGMGVVNVFVTQPQGDERRLDIKRQSQIDETQIVADQTVLARKISLERGQQALALLQTETKRRQAEEEQKIRLEQARIEAEVARLVRWVREWETYLQLVPDLSRQQHEQIVETIKAHGQILAKMAELGNLEVLGVSSRRRPEELGLNRLEAVLMQGLTNLRGLSQQSLGLALGNGDILQDPNLSLLLRLINEIKGLSTIEGLTWTHLKPDEDGGLCLEVQLNGMRLEITCRPGFPAIRPGVVVSINDHDKTPFLFLWSKPRLLKEVVLEASRHFSGVASTCDRNSSAPAA